MYPKEKKLNRCMANELASTFMNGKNKTKKKKTSDATELVQKRVCLDRNEIHN